MSTAELCSHMSQPQADERRAETGRGMSEKSTFNPSLPAFEGKVNIAHELDIWGVKTSL